jgi:hypothetical protein
MKLHARAALASAIVLGVLLGPATAALAEDSIAARDPNDTPGKLDMDALGMVLKNSGTLFVGVRTFGSWRDGLLDDAGDNRFVFYFNLDRDNKAEYIGKISLIDGVFTMTVDGKRQIDPIPVTRTGTTLKVKIPADSPLSQPDVKFSAKSRLTGSGKCSHTCVDRAPDSSALHF